MYNASIFESTNASHKDPMYRFAEKLFGQGLVTSSGSTYRIHRKVIVGMLNTKTVNSFVKYFDKHSRRCVELLELRIGTGEFDLYPYMEYCAVNSALDTIMGTPGITQEDGHKELMSCVARMYNLVVDRMMRIWLQVDWIYACTNHKKLQDNSLSVIRQFMDNLAAYNERMNLMDNDQAEDSITTVCSFVLLMLAMYPAIQEKVRTELSEVLGGETVTANKLSELEYLGRVIKETLHLFPIAPILMRKLTGNVCLESCTLPEGCTVAIVGYLTHGDPEYWSNPDKFNPDRFKPENSIGRHSHAYIPFSGGIRRYIGQQYGELYVKTVVANVIRKYRLNSNSSLNELQLKADYILRSTNGFKI